MKNRHYNYSNARYSSSGTMVCSFCNKKITTGDYRYYETPNAYISQHRACCADDPHWKELDNEQAALDHRNAEMLADATAFRAKWGVSDLDDLIGDLSKDVRKAGARIVQSLV